MGTQEEIIAEMIAPVLETALTEYLGAALWTEQAVTDRDGDCGRTWHECGYTEGQFGVGAVAAARTVVADMLSTVARERPADAWLIVRSKPRVFAFDLWATRQRILDAGFAPFGRDSKPWGDGIGWWLSVATKLRYPATSVYLATNGWLDFE